MCTVMILSFWTIRPGQTVQTQIRLFRGSQIQVCPVCHSIRIFLPHYSMVKPLCSNFRVITANFSGVQILGILRWVHLNFHSTVEQNQNSLLVKLQNDNRSPGPGLVTRVWGLGLVGELVLSSHLKDQCNCHILIELPRHIILPKTA